MHIAILGTGNVSSSLGPRFVAAGHRVIYCVRDPAKKREDLEAKRLNGPIEPMSAATQAEVVILAVPFREIESALQQVGDLSGKIVLDCTNPVNREFTDLTLGHTTSAGEEIARLLPNSQVVKIFNTNGANNMANPSYGTIRASMFYAGDHVRANEIAAQLAEEIGFEPIELGPLKYARLLEPLALTWIILARHRGWGRDFAINAVRRENT